MSIGAFGAIGSSPIASIPSVPLVGNNYDVAPGVLIFDDGTGSGTITPPNHTGDISPVLFSLMTREALVSIYPQARVSLLVREAVMAPNATAYVGMLARETLRGEQPPSNQIMLSQLVRETLLVPNPRRKRRQLYIDNVS